MIGKQSRRSKRRQRLIMPLDVVKLAASWQTEAYLNRLQCEHFGIDLVSLKDMSPDGGERDRTVHSIGSGYVINVGKDAVLGNTIVAYYPNVINHRTGELISIICRYSHMDTIEVLPGDELSTKTILGCYGKTGAYKIDPHLHIEIDTDIDSPYTTPTILRSNFLRRVLRDAKIGAMLNPLDVLHIKVTSPQQQYITADNELIRPEDKEIPYDETT